MPCIWTLAVSGASSVTGREGMTFLPVFFISTASVWQNWRKPVTQSVEATAAVFSRHARLAAKKVNFTLFAAFLFVRTPLMRAHTIQMYPLVRRRPARACIPKEKGRVFMKKSLLGYNKQAVDETIGDLEIRNTRLETQLKRLQAELDAARKELEAERERPEEEETDAGVLEQLRAENKALQAKNQALQAGKEQLRQERDSLAERLQAAGSVAASRDQLEQVTGICREAYEEMIHAKQQTQQGINDYVGAFWEEWNACQARMLQTARDMERAREEGREAFLSIADEILAGYEKLTEADARMQRQLSEMEETRSQVERQLEATIRSLDAEKTESAAEPEEEENGGYAVLQALRRREKENRPAEESPEAGKEMDAKETIGRITPVKPTAPMGNIGIAVGIDARNIMSRRKGS